MFLEGFFVLFCCFFLPRTQDFILSHHFSLKGRLDFPKSLLAWHLEAQTNIKSGVL